VVLGGGALLLAKNSNNKTASTTSTTPNQQSKSMNDNMQSSTSTKPAASTPSATNSVTIENFAFSPANITVKKGTTVTWTNKDSAAHTVTVTGDNSPSSGVSAGPDSGTLASGKTYSYTFSGTGMFKYHCAIHPSMTGTVTVTD
jgi:plastocyanin